MPNYEFDRTTMGANGVVNTIEYEPNGTDHRLQRRITELLDRLVQQDGRVTLAELGYLHMNTITYNRETSKVELKIYFDIHFAARTIKDSINGRKVILPVDELNLFQGYLFVGSVAKAVSFETVLAPKSKTIEDELKRPALKFKDDAKFVETDVLVLHCNLPITMAALHDLSLEDPGFSVRCTTTGKGNAMKEKTIIGTGKHKDVPVRVIVTAGQLVDENGDMMGYDPSLATNYLLALKSKQLQAAANKEKAAEKARDKADKKSSGGFIANRKAWSKYS